MERKAIKLAVTDNVATVVDDVKHGEICEIMGKDTATINSADNIPFGHKIALQNFKQGQEVIKYGEIIGIASIDIALGQHVHIHNLEGIRGRGDKK